MPIIIADTNLRVVGSAAKRVATAGGIDEIRRLAEQQQQREEERQQVSRPASVASSVSSRVLSESANRYAKKSQYLLDMLTLKD